MSESKSPIVFDKDVPDHTLGRYDGRVIRCRFVDGVPFLSATLPAWEIHHWRGKGGNAHTIAMPMCEGCHKKVERSRDMHSQFEHKFERFQAKLSPIYRSLNPQARTAQRALTMEALK